MQAEQSAANCVFVKLSRRCRYNFTEWAIALNTTSPDLERLLPPSDMRWRKDVRALEEGRYQQV